MAGLFLLLPLLVLTIKISTAFAQSANVMATEKDLHKNQSSLQSFSRLGTMGRWMVDEQSRVVILRGVNMVNKNPPSYTLSATGFREEDAKVISAAGLNVVRVGLIWSAIETFPGEYNDAYIEDIVSTVRMLDSYGIKSLLDMHQDQYSHDCYGDGAPDWATLVDPPFVKCNPEKIPFPVGELTVPSVANAWDNFWNNAVSSIGGEAGLQDRYAAAWQHVAQKFANTPGVIGYEIINEPYPGTKCKDVPLCASCAVFDKGAYSIFIDRVSNSIRNADQKTLIFFEPNVLFDFGKPSEVTPPRQTNIGFAFHPYDSLPHVLENAKLYSEGNPSLALFATEWGAFTDVGPTKVEESKIPQLITEGAQYLDQAMMPAIYWGYANPFDILPNASHQGLVNDLQILDGGTRKAPNLRVDRVNALTRPYPQAIAGTPRYWFYSLDAKTFDLIYQPIAPNGQVLAPDALTEVVLPAYNFPKGYDVVVDGARVMSKPDARVLLLMNQSATKFVTVQVKAR